jgi:hypothetical protein
LKKLPVIKFDTRAEVLPYLGARHIVGVKQWEPLAKARYIRQIFDNTLTGKPASERHKVVAAKIGSYRRTDYIRNNLNGLALYDIVESEDFYGIPDLSEETIGFGTLYTALGYSEIAEYVGLAKRSGDSYERVDLTKNPKAIKKQAVRRLIEWLFKPGTDNKTVVEESRGLARLAKVLGFESARKQLESGASLDTAYSYTDGMTEELAELLVECREKLRKANGIAPTSKPVDSHLRLVDELIELTESLANTLGRKVAKRKKGD